MKKTVLFLISFLMLNCSKDDDAVPDEPAVTIACEDMLPATSTTGANTFACCVNDMLVKPRDGDANNSQESFELFGGYPNTTDYYELQIRDSKSARTASVLLHIHNVHLNGLGSYTINESNGNSSIDGLNHTYMHCRIYSSKTGDYQFYRSFENSGVVKITNYNHQEMILSGTFSGRVKNAIDSTDIVEIKGGRFDLNGYTLPQTTFQ